MSIIFLIHGSYGNPQNNWFPWLRNEIKKLGRKVIAPRFPTPKRQTLTEWLRVFHKYEKYLDKNSILIGHSLGAAFILNLLEINDKPIKAAFLVAGFTGLLKNKKFDPLIKTFSNRKFNLKKIRQNCRNFYVFHSDNDPYVPLAKGKKLARNLHTRLILVKNAGHFNTEAKYLKFPLLLAKIRQKTC